jgi:hypothetical protein
MPSIIRPEELDVLIWEISSTPHTRLLLDLGRAEPAVARFADCRALVAFFHGAGGNHADKDLVLAAIVRAHARDRDPRWRSVLLAAFWPGLESLLVRRSHWDQDPDEVWQDLMITFLEVLCRLDPAKRSDRFAQKIVNDTAHRLHDRYERRWRLQAPETAMSMKELPRRADPRCTPERLDASIDLRELQERGTALLQRHREAGTIDDTDMAILVGTRLQGLTVADMAGRLGMTFDCAKKRRQRAEASIRAIGQVGAP